MTTFDLGIRLSTVRRLFVPLVSLIEKHSGYASDDSEIGAALTCRQRERKRTVEGFLKFKQRTDDEL